MEKQNPGDQAPACQKHFQHLHKTCGRILAESLFEDRIVKHATSFAFVRDIQTWCNVTALSTQTAALNLATTEYEFALLALVQGHYRHAFIGLRVCLELGLAGVHFATNQLEHREWGCGCLDIAWERLVDNDNGVLSKRFARGFFPALVDDVPHYNTLARKVYRECSELVHGNPHVGQLLGEPLNFSEAAFNRWHENADVVALILSFALSMRFLNELPADALQKLEETVLERVGHIAPIRGLLGGTVEIGS